MFLKIYNCSREKIHVELKIQRAVAKNESNTVSCVEFKATPKWSVEFPTSEPQRMKFKRILNVALFSEDSTKNSSIIPSSFFLFVSFCFVFQGTTPVFFFSSSALEPKKHSRELWSSRWINDAEGELMLRCGCIKIGPEKIFGVSCCYTVATVKCIFTVRLETCIILVRDT